MNNEIISIREFSRRMSVDDKTIRHGIKNKKLDKGVTIEDGKPKIIFEIAVKEFEESGLGFRSRLIKEPTIEIPKPEKVKPEKKVQKQKPESKPKVNNKKEDYSSEDLTESTSLSTANRLERIYKARKAKAEAEALEGIQVNKQEVYIQLFEFGRQIRKEFETLKTRIAPAILKSEIDEMKINEIIDEEVFKSLSKLFDDLQNKKLC